MTYRSIYTGNLTSIQLKHNHVHQHYYFSVKSNIFFICKLEREKIGEDILSSWSFEDENYIYLVHIPFFTFTMPEYIHTLPICGSHISLLGSILKNKWVLFNYNLHDYLLCSSDFCSGDYTFNIY